MTYMDAIKIREDVWELEIRRARIAMTFILIASPIFIWFLFFMNYNNFGDIKFGIMTIVSLISIFSYMPIGLFLIYPMYYNDYIKKSIKNRYRNIDIKNSKRLYSIADKIILEYEISSLKNDLDETLIQSKLLSRKLIEELNGKSINFKDLRSE